MAIMRQSLNFGGVNSADFGIYISGEGVFNAPKRAVEMVSIPGRNGALVIDQGYYENITVTYPAFNAEDNLEDFKKNLAAFRNALCSQKGYQRLIDSFHKTEYRMALFSGGLEIKPVEYNTAATFEIVFDCKPQRFLVSGETGIAVESGEELINPTPYEASPLLEVEGYGTIGFNGYEIDLENALMGDVEVASRNVNYLTFSPYNFYLDKKLFNAGDTVTLGSGTLTLKSRTITSLESIEVSSSTFDSHILLVPSGNKSFSLQAKIPSQSFDSSQSQSWSYELTMTAVVDGTTRTYTVSVNITFDGTRTFTVQVITSGAAYESRSLVIGRTMADSTLSILGNPTYIDCEAGECYKIVNGEIVGLNAYVDLGSKLPNLAPGENTVTYDNTITALEITPRWWQL